MSYLTKEQIQTWAEHRSVTLEGKECKLHGIFHESTSRFKYFKDALDRGGSEQGWDLVIAPDHITKIKEMDRLEVSKEYGGATKLEIDFTYTSWAYMDDTPPEEAQEYFSRVRFSQTEASGILKRHFEAFRSDTREGQYYRNVIKKTAEILGLTWD